MAYATPDDLALDLSIRVTPQNEAKMQKCIDTSTAEMDHEIGADPTAPPVWSDEQLALLNRVCTTRAAEWYKANEALWGAIGFEQTGILRAPQDGFGRRAYDLIPLKQSWGIA